MKATWTVTELTNHISNIFSEDEELRAVLVAGEISNFKHHTSGHMYFTLKDEASVIRCAMFRSANSKIKFRPEDGMRVLVHGSVSVYAASGIYQLYPDRMEPDGLGSLYLAFEQCKMKLEKEGLFRAEIKRKIPLLPRKIGVVTSATGAVIKDIQNVLFRRFPRATLVLSPTAVQGQDAPDQIAAALAKLSFVKDVDVIILARGGGSLEDLWPFNSELIARAIRACKVPVISAVGHETDFTISDMAADLRAPTPSAAAELVCPDAIVLRGQLLNYILRCKNVLTKKLSVERTKLDSISNRQVYRKPQATLSAYRLRLDGLSQRAQYGVGAQIGKVKNLVGKYAAMLDVLSPLHVLARGYASVTGADGRAISSVMDLQKGDIFLLRLHDGLVTAVANEISPIIKSD